MRHFGIDEYKQAQDALDNKWITARPELNKGNFSRDGVLNYEEWKNTSPRILYLLKEMSNSNQKYIRGYDGSPKNSGKQKFWRYINIWNEAIFQAFDSLPANFRVSHAKKENPVKSCAYINIKKYTQNNKTSSDSEIINYASNDREFLKDQIELINPDVIICGGTATLQSAKVIFDLFENDKVQLIRKTNTLLIDFYHPSNRIGYEKTFNRLNKLLYSDTAQDFISKIKA